MFFGRDNLSIKRKKKKRNDPYTLSIHLRLQTTIFRLVVKFSNLNLSVTSFPCALAAFTVNTPPPLQIHPLQKSGWRNFSANTPPPSKTKFFQDILLTYSEV